MGDNQVVWCRLGRYWYGRFVRIHANGVQIVCRAAEMSPQPSLDVTREWVRLPRLRRYWHGRFLRIHAND